MTRQNEPPDAEACVWPTFAHPVFSPAFPLCGMTLCPSGEGTMLAALLGIDERGRHFRLEPLVHASVSRHPAA